jgi:hypothetical protein
MTAVIRQKPRLVFQSGGTKVAAPSKKRTSGLPTGSFFRREAKNQAQADRKPLARYGAMEGALARGLLLPASKLDADRDQTPIDSHAAQDFTMRLTPTKFENIIDLATRGEPPLVAGFRS